MADTEQTITAALVDNLSASDTLMQTLTDIAEGVVAHLPFLVAGLLVLLLTALAAPVTSALLARGLQSANRRESFVDLIALLGKIAVWVMGITVAAMILFPGLTPTKALGGLGIASVAVGLAFRDIFENFFAGILLLWKFPFEKGDWVECGDISGCVQDITVRMTALRTVRGELIVVPNAVLYKNAVQVLTLEDTRRIEIITGIAYDEDIAEAVPVIRDAVSGCDSVDDTQPVQVFAKAFGASSIDIEVAWWAGSTPLQQRESRAEVVTQIKAALDAAGIEIPYPYRTLVFKDDASFAAPRIQLAQTES